MHQGIRVIVVNYNAGDLLLRSVAAVLSGREAVHLVVMDNASTDGSCEKLRSLYRSHPRVEILENAHNLGFARAVNACAARASETYLLILNPDCELYPGALSLLKQALDDNEQAGLAAPQVIDHQEQVMSGTLRSFPHPARALMSGTGLSRLGRYIPLFRGVEHARTEMPDTTVTAEAVSGACMLVRRSVFEQLGGFDERFGMHFEDLDLMYRMKQAGFQRLYVPAARAFHQAGTSSRSRPAWVHRQKHKGLLLFWSKHLQPQPSSAKTAMLRIAVWAHYVLTWPLVMLRR